MSSLLKEAIVDAKALREAALKNAENAVIDKYSNEVRKTLNALLEQEDVLGDMDLDMGNPEELSPQSATDDFDDAVGTIPYAAENGLSSLKGSKNLDDSLEDEELSTVTLDLGALREHVQKINEQKEEVLEIEDDEKPDAIMKEEEEDDEVEIEEEKELDLDSLTNAIVEKLTVDMGADLAGWAGRSSDDMKYQMEKEMAHRRTTEVEEELETLKKAQEELVFENKKLTSELSKYRTAIGEMKESVNDINLSNARLLYTNRVLRNTSLNERQKEQIVEAILKSDSVNEARTIYNTLQSTVKSTPSRGPRSLSEAINRPSSLIRATRKESKEPNDVFAERMKKLAGIK